MTDQHTYGHTKSGEPITDEMIERFAEEAAVPGLRTGHSKPYHMVHVPYGTERRHAR